MNGIDLEYLAFDHALWDAEPALTDKGYLGEDYVTVLA